MLPMSLAGLRHLASVVGVARGVGCSRKGFYTFSVRVPIILFSDHSSPVQYSPAPLSPPISHASLGAHSSLGPHLPRPPSTRFARTRFLAATAFSTSRPWAVSHVTCPCTYSSRNPESQSRSERPAMLGNEGFLRKASLLRRGGRTSTSSRRPASPHRQGICKSDSA